MLLKGDKWYKYSGKRDLESLSSFFLKEEYLTRDVKELSGTIPRRLEGWERTQQDAIDFLTQLAHAIDQMFEKTNLQFVPKFVRYGGIALMVLSPLIMVIYMMVFDDSDDVPLPDSERAKRAQGVLEIERKLARGKAPAKGKKEKLN